MRNRATSIIHSNHHLLLQHLDPLVSLEITSEDRSWNSNTHKLMSSAIRIDG